MIAPHAVLFEQVQTLYRQSTSTFAGTLLAGAVATFVLLPSEPSQGVATEMLWAWFAAVVLLTIFRFYKVRRFFSTVRHAPSQQLGDPETQRAARAFAAGSFASGCLWGILGAMAFDPEAYAPTMFLGFLLGGMVSGALGSLSVYYPAFLAFTIPTGLPFAFRCMSDGQQEFVGFGLLTLVFMLVSLGYGRGLNRSLRRSIELRFENARLLRDLAAARDRAELASADKTALLAAATHDLRQPAYAAGLFATSLRLVLTKAFVGMDDAGRSAAQQAQRLAGQLEASVAAFNSLLEGLLDLAQLDARATPLAASPVNVRQMLDGVANTLAATATQRQMTLRVRASPILWTMAPPDALQRIVVNLTSNAIKFSNGHDVLLFARLERGHVRIGVADAGPGIAESDQLRLFNAFVRLPQNRNDAGLGLGLAIVKRLATQIGAQVKLVSATGHASIFSVSLPMLAAAPALAPPANDLPSDLPDIKGWLALVLDDDALARSATASAVESLGLAVQQFATAQAALDWLTLQMGEGDLKHGKYLLITDLHLNEANGHDGLSVLAAFRQRLPILHSLVITGETAPSQLQRIAQSGVDVIRKPCQPQALESALRAILTG